MDAILGPILAFLNNPLVLTGAAGLFEIWWKRDPGKANQLHGLVAFLGVFFTKLAGVTTGVVDAHASPFLLAATGSGVLDAVQVGAGNAVAVVVMATGIVKSVQRLIQGVLILFGKRAQDDPFSPNMPR